MIELAEEPLFTILRNFRNGGYCPCVLPAQIISFISIMALNFVYQRMINLRECYSIFLNVLSKQLINIHITHFQLPLKHSERYLRYSDVRPIYRIEAIDPKDTFLLSQYLSRTQIQHKLPKCINAFYQL